MGDPAWAALRTRMDELLAMTKLSSYALAKQIGMPKSTVSQYFNREPGAEVQLCKWDFMQKLMAAAENTQGQVLGEDYRLETAKRHQAVAKLYADRDLAQVTDLIGQTEQATAKLSRAYFETRRLENEDERLRRENLPTDDNQHLLRAQRLEAAKWRGVRQALRAQAAELDEQNPPGQWILRVPGAAPGAEPHPSWWPEDDTAYPGFSTVKSTRRAGRLALAAVVLVLVVAGSVFATLALSSHGSGEPQGDPPASSATGNTAQTSSNGPAPAPTAQTTTADDATAKYTDTSITMPGDASTQCQIAGIDFDTPEGSAGLDDMTTDLYAVGACALEGDGPIINSNRQWGTAPAQQPTAAQCVQDADTRTLPEQIQASAFTIGSAYCLITGESNVVWFVVTANSNDSYTVNATLWLED
jgi:hypothetical protein